MIDLSIQQIKTFYYNDKLSCAEISERIGASQWSILSFMKKNNLPRRNFRDSNAVKFEKKPLTFSAKEILSLKEEKLKIAGLMVYWAEGAKIKKKGKNSTVDLANSDPEIIKLFLRFLREICRVSEDKLRVFLYCYINQDIEKIKNFWAKITNISLNQFTKPYIKDNFSFDKEEKMKYGLAHIRYNDKKLLLKIDFWTKEFINNMGTSDSSNSTSL